jgi:hypothetical protein
MDGTVDVTIPVDAAAASLLADVRNVRTDKSFLLLFLEKEGLLTQPVSA